MALQSPKHAYNTGEVPMRHRLTADPAEAVNRHITLPRLFGDLGCEFPIMLRINAAHVVMLAECSILPAADAAAILGGLDALAAEGPEGLDLDPAREDLHLNIEYALMQRIGEAGGRLHTARSRNDLYAAVQRMKCRDKLHGVFAATSGLVGALLDKAEAHAETVMTGYTHLQPAQPITLGHFLSGVAGGLLRDLERLSQAYDRTNLSPLGACALAGTGFPIDRVRTADLLGFDGLVENTLDCVAARDYLIDIAFALAAYGTTLSRLTLDLHNWVSPDYGLLDIEDSVAGISSIMPQKKNPVAIEQSKAKVAHAAGALTSVLCAQSAASYTNTREAGHESGRLIGEAVSQTVAAAELVEAVIANLRVDPAKLEAHARNNFCTFTELADTLVRGSGCSFRTAHEIVGALTKEADRRGIARAVDVTAEMVNAAACAHGVAALGAAEIAAALDPRENVQRRCLTGGPAPAEVVRMVTGQKAALERVMADWRARAHRLESAAEMLAAARETMPKAA
jgi:argininosuccinate lyase